jgi:hypothetical protein
VRAGTRSRAALEIENAGAVAWRSDGPAPVYAAYHWLDSLGNPIVWDGRRSPLPRPIEPGMRSVVDVTVIAPLPPGRYRLAFDLIAEGRFWFAEIGSSPSELDVDVAPRLQARTLAVHVAAGPPELAAWTARGLDELDEPVARETDAAEAVAYLAAGCVPARDWSRRVLDAHAEGFGIVGGSIDDGRRIRRGSSALEPYAPGRGRIPDFPHPLVCPSVLVGVAVDWLEPVAGLPTIAPPRGENAEPWVYDGRIALSSR